MDLTWVSESGTECSQKDQDHLPSISLQEKSWAWSSLGFSLAKDLVKPTSTQDFFCIKYQGYKPTLPQTLPSTERKCGYMAEEIHKLPQSIRTPGCATVYTHHSVKKYSFYFHFLRSKALMFSFSFLSVCNLFQKASAPQKYHLRNSSGITRLQHHTADLTLL